jgi:hypothetical protein
VAFSLIVVSFRCYIDGTCTKTLQRDLYKKCCKRTTLHSELRFPNPNCSWLLQRGSGVSFMPRDLRPCHSRRENPNDHSERDLTASTSSRSLPQENESIPRCKKRNSGFFTSECGPMTQSKGLQGGWQYVTRYLSSLDTKHRLEKSGRTKLLQSPQYWFI